MVFTKKTRLMAVVMLFLCMLMAASFYYIGWVRPLAINGDITSIKVSKNTTMYQLSEQLHSKDWVRSPHFVRWVAELKGYRHLMFGEYQVKSGMTIAQLLINMVRAKGLVSHQITFVEGATFNDILALLQQDNNVTHTLSGLTPSEVMQRIGAPQTQPEGLFFPDTYHFTWRTKDVVILKMAFLKMRSVMQKYWPHRAKSLPYKDAYQALIVASLVQSEAVLDNERPVIASVIVNRLRKRMRLQIDPTVMYGLHLPFGSELSRKDLTTPSLYNTYRNYGLPPTPIDMPGLKSIRAALQPGASDYLYYVAKGGGAHQFSTSYRQHYMIQCFSKCHRRIYCIG